MTVKIARLTNRSRKTQAQIDNIIDWTAFFHLLTQCCWKNSESDMYQKHEYISSRPKSSYRKRAEGVDYDSYARVPDSESREETPRAKPPARPVSRRRMERNSNFSDSDDNYVPSSPDGPLVSPKSPTSNSRHPSNQNIRKSSSEFVQPYSLSDSRPPTSGSARPPSASARRRSARLHHRDNNSSQANQNDSSESLSNTPGIRPPSSFSKYRPLPAIGTPTPADCDEPKFIHNDLPDNPSARDQFPFNNQPQNDSHLQMNANEHYLGHRISSAVSDISVISTKANSSRRASENIAPTELIERLDLSQLEKLSENTRRRKPSSNQSPSHKPKSAVSTHSKFDSCELYDGDDDDSDTNIDCVNTFTQGKKENTQNLPRTPMTKNPVIIPSQNELAATNLEQEILLAVKLPTNGTRHQRYFQRTEPLMSIVEFAEEQAGQDFAGYILVSSGPKNVYEDLHQSIEEAGLEDRSMLHLEEND